jgi:hypothetical protein
MSFITETPVEFSFPASRAYFYSTHESKVYIHGAQIEISGLFGM